LTGRGAVPETQEQRFTPSTTSIVFVPGCADASDRTRVVNQPQVVRLHAVDTRKIAEPTALPLRYVTTIGERVGISTDHSPGRDGFLRPSRTHGN